jgi:hypothetical protein
MALTVSILAGLGIVYFASLAYSFAPVTIGLGEKAILRQKISVGTAWQYADIRKCTILEMEFGGRMYRMLLIELFAGEDVSLGISGKIDPHRLSGFLGDKGIEVETLL